jgi:hypothetical protein
VNDRPGTREERIAETVRRIVTRRERAPRSPRLERAFKRLLWRYTELRAQEKDRAKDGE